MNDEGDRTTAAVAVRGLDKAFGKKAVLTGLDLAIAPRTAVGLMGANGSGKTTLIKILLGLLPADGGEVLLFGEPAHDLSVAARRRISYVPQASNQFPWLTGRAMLRYVGSFYPSFDWPYANDLIERWKVSVQTRIGALSPGQQQRLSIVRALATRPDLVVLDEPIASLDPMTRTDVIAELVAERSRRPLTVIFSSHIIGDLERLCTHFAVLNDRKVAAYADVGTRPGGLEAVVTELMR